MYKRQLQMAAIDKKTDELIEMFDVRSGQGRETITRSMSGGNQQKAIIAREIDRSPELLIVVQPTRGLDVGAIEYIHKRIVQERDNGKAILLVSLELDEIMALSDQIAVMFNGAVSYTHLVMTVIILAALLCVAHCVAALGQRQAGFQTASLPLLIVVILVLLVGVLNRFIVACLLYTSILYCKHSLHKAMEGKKNEKIADLCFSAADGCRLFQQWRRNCHTDTKR